MPQNKYPGVVEPWKIQLITARLQRRRLRRHDAEDAAQRLVVAVRKFRYDPAHSHGASEATALTALIDHQISTLLRSRARYRKHLDRFVIQRLPDSQSLSALRGSAHCDDLAHLAIDVRDALQQLPQTHRAVCQMLADGQSVTQIARTLGWSWHRVHGVITEVREQFSRIGLDGWIRG